MTFHWQPVEDDVDPDTIDVWHVEDDGTQTNIGPADVSDVNGMPDSLGGIAPDAVREIAAEYKYQKLSPGNSPSHSHTSAQTARDIDKLDFVRGSPP